MDRRDAALPADPVLRAGVGAAIPGVEPRPDQPAALLVEGAIVAWLIGSLFYLLDRALDRPAIRQLPYGALMLVQAAGNLGLVVVALACASLIETAKQGRGFEFALIQDRVLSANFLVVAVYVTVVSFLFSFLRQVDGKSGPGNLWKLIIGMYHHPREEERIFMFLDLKGSTTHAERLGHVKFSRLIQDCFIDLSVVIDHQAQIYQYVGDEAILFWDVAAGLENASCIRAFFRYTDRLESRAGYYQSQYGVLPVFKAGIHVGSAMVLEVGEIKREISYLGDLLNTAARIQGECNRLGENLLVSESLRGRLGEIPDDLSMTPIGKIELKGRTESVGILSVRREGPRR
jgi:adenylate cyclase